MKKSVSVRGNYAEILNCDNAFSGEPLSNNLVSSERFYYQKDDN